MALPQRLLLALPLAGLVAGAGLAAPEARAAAFPTTAEDVLVVDCLLPGQVRRVGKIKGFLTQRRPARLSQFECAYRGGEYVAYDRATLATSVQVWQGSAEGGDVEAMNVLGEAYAKGLGQAPDYASAKLWFERAAAAGSAKALQNLGHLYENGLGVAQDRERALDYFRRALGPGAESLVYSSDALRAAELRAEVEALRGSQARSEAEAAQLRSTLAERDRALAEAVASMRRLRAEYEALKSRSQDASAEGVWKLLEESIRAREGEIAAQKAEIETLRARAGGAVAPPYVQIGPELTLKLETPVVLAARGRPVALLPDNAEPLRLRGQAAPAESVAEVQVDGRPIAVDAAGNFELVLDAGGERAVTVLARARGGSETRAEFQLLSPAPVAGATALAASGPRPAPSAMRSGAARALLIAVSGYQQYPGLPTPRADVELLAGVLRERYGFEVRTIVDPTRVDLLLALHAFRQSLANEDSGLIYFAGHGEIDAAQKGYWIPSDGDRGDPKTWVANQVVTDMLAVSDARHLMVIADSCYSGTLARGPGEAASDALPPEQWRAWAEASAAGRSRVALTSGGLRPVPETSTGRVSTFATALAGILREQDGALEAQRVHRELTKRIALDPAAQAFGQRPEFAPMQFAGHERGELFFVPRGG